MDRAVTADPVEAVNAYAAQNGWLSRIGTELTFVRPELNLLRDLWSGKAAGRPIPYRRDFDARALKPVLCNIVIVERVCDCGRMRLRLRLVGSDIASLFGDSTGKHLDEIIPAALLTRWEMICHAVLDSGRPVRIVSHYDLPRVNYLSGESLLAPMLDAEGNPTLLLWCAYFQSAREALAPPG